MDENSITKILFMDSDEMAFAIRQCIARAITSLPPVELFHVTRASDALDALESICPDVLVIDDSCLTEFEILLENYQYDHPPILLQSDNPTTQIDKLSDIKINYIEKSASLDGLRRTIVAATDLAHGRVNHGDAILH